MPPVDDKTRKALQDRLAAARKKRDKAVEDAERAKEEAERRFWQTVDQELTNNGYHGAQADAVETLQYTRDHILKSVKKYRGKSPK